MPLKDWSTSPAANTSIDGTDIGEGCPAAGINNAIRSVMASVKKVLPTYHPDDWGAVGNGITNDHDAFEDMMAAIVTAGGGVIELNPGAHYRFGKQTANATAFHDGNIWRRAPSYLIGATTADAVDYIHVNGNGAILEWVDDQYFGAFDESMAALPGVTAPGNLDKAAAPGWCFFFQGVGEAIVRDLEVRGNAPNCLLGGEYGDQGWQLPYTAFGTYDSPVYCDNVKVNGTGLDGFICENVHASADEEKIPFVLNRCVAESVARNCLSVTGGIDQRLTDCRFADAGGVTHADAPSTVLASAPASCCDLEEEGGVVRNFHALRCQFIGGANSNTAFVADSGDIEGVTLDDCELEGNVWAEKPYIIIRGGDIRGKVVKLWGGDVDPEANTLFDGVRFTDAPLGDAPAATGTLLDTINTAAGPGVRVRNGRFVLNRTALTLATGIVEGVVDVMVKTGTGDFADLATLINLNETTGDGLIRIFQDMALPPATGYAISTVDAVIRGEMDASVTKLAWHAAAVSAGNGVRGTLGMAPVITSLLQLNKRALSDPTAPGSYGFQGVSSDNAMPASGAYVAGHLVLNDTPSVTTGRALLGWLRLTTGSGHVLDTDWVGLWIPIAAA